jgi:hypothetical protein
VVCQRRRPPRRHRAQGKEAAQAVLGQRSHHRDHGASTGGTARPPQPHLAACLTRPGEDPGGTAVRLLSCARPRLFPLRSWERTAATPKPTPNASTSRCAPSGTRSSWTTRRPNSGVRPTAPVRSWSKGPSTARPCPSLWSRASADLRQERHRCGHPQQHVLRPGRRGASCARKGPMPMATSASPVRPAVSIRTCAARSGPLRRPRPRQDPGSSRTGGPAQGLHPVRGHHRSRHRRASSPGPGVRVARVGRTYATYRNTIEGINGYVKDTAHQSLGSPGRRRVRGLQPQRDSNPCRHLERVVSLASRRWGRAEVSRRIPPVLGGKDSNPQ